MAEKDKARYERVRIFFFIDNKLKLIFDYIDVFVGNDCLQEKEVNGRWRWFTWRWWWRGRWRWWGWWLSSKSISCSFFVLYLPPLLSQSFFIQSRRGRQSIFTFVLFSSPSYHSSLFPLLKCYSSPHTQASTPPFPCAPFPSTAVWCKYEKATHLILPKLTASCPSSHLVYVKRDVEYPNSVSLGFWSGARCSWFVLCYYPSHDCHPLQFSVNQIFLNVPSQLCFWTLRISFGWGIKSSLDRNHGFVISPTLSCPLNIFHNENLSANWNEGDRPKPDVFSLASIRCLAILADVWLDANFPSHFCRLHSLVIFEHFGVPSGSFKFFLFFFLCVMVIKEMILKKKLRRNNKNW